MGKGAGGGRPNHKKSFHTQIGEVLNLAKITSELVGTPYELGGCNGLDCFSLIAKYLEKRGIAIPADLIFKGHKLSEYPVDYKSDPKKMIRVAVDYIASLMTEIHKNKAVGGDVLFVKIEDNESLVIAGGNGTIVAATGENGTVVLNQRNYTIKRAFRCPKT